MGSSYYLLYQYAYRYRLLHFDIVMVQEAICTADVLDFVNLYNKLEVYIRSYYVKTMRWQGRCKKGKILIFSTNTLLNVYITSAKLQLFSVENCSIRLREQVCAGLKYQDLSTLLDLRTESRHLQGCC